jgi:hypothetical protein
MLERRVILDRRPGPLRSPATGNRTDGEHRRRPAFLQRNEFDAGEFREHVTPVTTDARFEI